MPREKAPPGWDRRDLPSGKPTPAPRFGQRWVCEMRSAVLKVPSAVLPQECNHLFNPQHPEFAQLNPGRALAVRLDDRLWR